MRKFVILSLFIFSTLLVIGAIIFWTHQFLSAHHPLKSDNILIEGWVSSYEVEETVKIIHNNKNAQLYIIGKNYATENQSNSNVQLVNSGDPIILTANGSIVISFEDNTNYNQADSLNLILILKGSKAKDIFSHVSVAINGNYMQSFFTNDNKEEYHVMIPPEKIKGISISFDNDLYTENEDRNLFLYGVSPGNDELDLAGTKILITNDFTKKNTGFSSSAEHMAIYISDLGIEPSKVHSINFKKPERNQTLNGAKAFMKVNDTLYLSSFNVISSGIHSRRTWKTYQRLFEEKAEVGVFYFKPIGYNEINWYKKPQGYVQLFNEMVEFIANEFYSSTDS